MICQQYLIGDTGFENIFEKGLPNYFSLLVRMPFYRSFPLSCLHDIALVVDGILVDQPDMSFCLNGEQYAIPDLSKATFSWWGMFEKGMLIVRRDDGLSEGDHIVDLTIRVRFPYIPPETNGNQPALYISHDRKVLAIRRLGA